MHLPSRYTEMLTCVFNAYAWFIKKKKLINSTQEKKSPCYFHFFYIFNSSHSLAGHSALQTVLNEENMCLQLNFIVDMLWLSFYSNKYRSSASFLTDKYYINAVKLILSIPTDGYLYLFQIFASHNP